MEHLRDRLEDVPPSGGWDGHHLLMAGVEDAWRARAAWAEAGLRRGEQMIYAADAQHPCVERLAASLTTSGVDVAHAAEDGQLIVVDTADFYSVPGYEQLVAEALRLGYRGARSYGGPQLAAEVLGPAQFEEFERMLERMWTTRGVTAVCCYDPVMVAGAGELDQAVTRHSSGWTGHLICAHSPDAGRLGLIGEIDVSNDDLLAAVLAAATRSAGVELIVDCAQLRYMSVSGWRAALSATQPFRERGGRVRLVALTTTTARVLQMIGFAEVFELEPAS
jgi:anti-anti-sigma factor